MEEEIEGVTSYSKSIITDFASIYDAHLAQDFDHKTVSMVPEEVEIALKKWAGEVKSNIENNLPENFSPILKLFLKFLHFSLNIIVNLME